MGLLSEGKAFTWAETKEHAELVKRTGILQFLSTYHKLKDRPPDDLKWGDEVEYALVSIDDENKRARVHLIGPETLLTLKNSEDPDDQAASWGPEYASYMIEGTPAVPYGGSAQDLQNVEANMVLRRRQLRKVIKKYSTIPLTITAFPRVGCSGFTLPEITVPPLPPASMSLYFPDEAVWSGHPRFITLTRNIRERRGEKVTINIPIFKDKHTPSPFTEMFPADTGKVMALPDHIYMDCMGFGMSCCCLQVTFQACNLQEARILYDQLAVVAPIMMSLSVATPAFRGYLVDTECRWKIITDAVDDRTAEERGIKPLSESPFTIPTSRFHAVDCYLTNQEYNDKPVLYDQKFFQILKDGGVDDLLAQHVAHLFIRDPISLFEEFLHQSVDDETDHFENIQSTNWQSMRFKPPPPNSTIGWRVEFRPLDNQLTDFENAAFVVFVVLLTRTILSFKLNFFTPISKMQENVERAQKRDSVISEKFFFRKHILPDDTDTVLPDQSHDEEYTEMSINTIMNGKDDFPGLIPLVRMYVNSIEIDMDTRCTVMKYLQLISRKASGELMTTAKWIRCFLTSHPLYKNDSIITDEMTYDLVKRMQEISEGVVPCPELTADFIQMRSFSNSIG